MPKKKTLSQHQDLMKEWDYEKNVGLDPASLSEWSHIKAYWKCSKCGYEWKTAIRVRCINGCGCRKCGIKKCQDARRIHYDQVNGTVADVCPELVEEWDYKRNGDLRPEDISIGSGEDVWWICKKCHNNWHTRVYHRAKNGTGCRKCASKVNAKELTQKYIDERGSLLDNYPELAKEWDYEKNGDVKPEDVMSYSNVSYWWVCPFGHKSYQATPNNRLKPSGCPECKKYKQTSVPEKIIFYYLTKIFPDAIQNYKHPKLCGMELDVYLPDINLGVEYDGEAWHKDVEKDTKKTKLCKLNGIRLVRFREPKCPPLNDGSICYKLEGNNNDNNSFNVPVRWLLDYIKQTYKINGDVDVDIERDYMDILKLIELEIKDNSIGKAIPEVCEQWDYDKMKGVTPFQISLHSKMPIWLRCTMCQKSFKTTAEKRSQNSELSKVCDACKWNYKTTLDMRYRGRKRTPYAIEKTVEGKIRTLIKRKGSLLDNYPEVAKEWDYELNGDLKPQDILSGSSKRIHWICSVCGHKWINSPCNRTRQGQNCPECGKKKCVETRKKNRLNGKYN